MPTVTVTGVVPQKEVSLGVEYEIVPSYEFAQEQNRLACRIFNSINPAHVEKDIIPGSLLTGWVAERLYDWVMSCDQLCPGEGRLVLLNQMTISFRKPVKVGQPVQLVASVVEMDPVRLEFRVGLRLTGTGRLVLEGAFTGMLVGGRLKNS